MNNSKCPTCLGSGTITRRADGAGERCEVPPNATVRERCPTCNGSGEAPTEGEKPANYRLPCGHYGGRCTIEGGCVRPDPQLEADEELRRSRGGDRMVCANCGFKHEGVGQSAEHPILGELGQPESDKTGMCWTCGTPAHVTIPHTCPEPSPSGTKPVEGQHRTFKSPDADIWWCKNPLCSFVTDKRVEAQTHQLPPQPKPTKGEHRHNSPDQYWNCSVCIPVRTACALCHGVQEMPNKSCSAPGHPSYNAWKPTPTPQPIEGKEPHQLLEQVYKNGLEGYSVDSRHGQAYLASAKAQLTKYVLEQLIAELEEMYKCSPSQETYEWVNERIAQLRKGTGR